MSVVLQFLSNCVVGASLEEITEEEEEEDENKSMMPEASSPRLKEGTFQVVGTLSTPPREPEPDFAVETYRVSPKGRVSLHSHPRHTSFSLLLIPSLPQTCGWGKVRGKVRAALCPVRDINIYCLHFKGLPEVKNLNKIFLGSMNVIWTFRLLNFSLYICCI